MIFSNVKLLLKDSYLIFIKNSVGAKSFQNFYAKVDGREKDILEAGNLSCAFFASAVLLVFDLIKERHTTVKGVLADMEDNGWFEIKKPRKGSVLIWGEQQKGAALPHAHIGFFIGGNRAISNSSKYRVPKIHHLTFGKNRKGQPHRPIIKILWNNKLDD